LPNFNFLDGSFGITHRQNFRLKNTLPTSAHAAIIAHHAHLSNQHPAFLSPNKIQTQTKNVKQMCNTIAHHRTIQ
jgi:hypothetical protein